MEKIKLGLDIGTNSIGWAVLVKQDKKYHFLNKEDKNGNLIPTKGSYIFPKGTLGNENSKAAERRGFRSARRRIDRIRLRKIAVLKVLEKFDLCPPFIEGELNKWKNKKKYPVNNEEFIKWQRTGNGKGDSEKEKLKQPYYLRYLAATQPDLMGSKHGRWQLGRAFYHIAQRRGYISNSEDESTDDKLELFKDSIKLLVEENLHEETFIYSDFIDAYQVIADSFKNDDKAKRLSNKIRKFIDKNSSSSSIQSYIEKELKDPENMGKVAKGVSDLSIEIEKSGLPTMGSYFHSIYAKKNGAGVVNKIRGKYTHRELHYEKEFNYICDLQKINGELRKKLYNAIFYQRPLKSQRSLVAKCPLETNRKRIAISHPLFEEFRMWESINRIKIKKTEDNRLRFLNRFEKELLIKIFQRKNDFEFETIAKELSGGRTFRYAKDKNIQNAEVEFNFSMDKKFSACPITYSLKRVLKEKYLELPFLNNGYKGSDKHVITIEDTWHCLFTDSFGNKNKTEYRKHFALRRLRLSDKEAEEFAKIRIPKGYGSLSKAAIKKILPYLREGELYSHAVFLANISNVLGRDLIENENEKVVQAIKKAINNHREVSLELGIINNCISDYKDNDESLGDNETSIEAFKRNIQKQIKEWLGELLYSQMPNNEKRELNEKIWTTFKQVVKDKSKKDIEFQKGKTIPEFIYNELKREFPDDAINIKIDKLYHPSAIEAYPKTEKELGNPEISSIKNPVFNKAMHQIKQLVNELIKNELVNKDTEVNIEVAGEINSASYRRAFAQWQKDQEDIKVWAKDEIQKLYKAECGKDINPSDDEITKFILWKEQNHHCLYTSKSISICEFLGGETIYDIEHTIPRSKFNDNSVINKTLTNADFNRNYKKTQLPAKLNLTFNEKTITSQTIIDNRDKFLKSYSMSKKVPTWNVSLVTLKNDLKKFKNAAKAITDTVSHDDIMFRIHYTLFKLNYLEEKYQTFEIEEVSRSFTSANLVDTRIITKYARAYLNSYFNKVNVINGKITDTLRKIWSLQGENEPKNRSNHIHHCIDAVTIACVEKGTVNRLSEAFHKYEREYFDEHLEHTKVYMPPPMNDFVKTMKNLYKEVFIYHQKKDRIKPMLKNIENSNKLKINLRGTLNKPNPYGYIQKKGERFFVQRKLIDQIEDKDIPNIVDDMIKTRINKLIESSNEKLERLIENGILILPEYKYFNKKNNEVTLKEVVLKKIRIKAYKQGQYAIKKYRKIDLSKKNYKRDVYVLKEKNSNYEARIYGDLIPDKPEGRSKFSNRDYLLINSINLVKNCIPEEPQIPFLFSIHEGDIFFVFDKHTDEIEWNNREDLANRLFKIRKFDEDENIILQRHDYSTSEQDLYTSENSIANREKGFLLKKVPSSLRAIPAKIDKLGRIDIEYSKSFIDQHIDK